MADAIQWSLPLGNGAVNLHYNEVVYSWINGQPNVSTYDYEIMIILNPQCVSSFIFTRYAYGQYSVSNTAIDLAKADGTTLHSCTLNWGNNRYSTLLYNNAIGFLLK